MTAPGSAFWSRHVFVLASPDALRRGLSRRLVARLRREGFAPVAGRLVRTRPEMIDDLYADVIAGQWQTWRYRLVDRAFAIGPTLAMLCEYRGDRDDPHRMLSEAKGSSNPERAKPGTIRKEFGAINSVLGLMHSSDDAEESRKDAAVYGLAESDAVLAGAEVDYLSELCVPAIPETRGYDAVLTDLRARILAASWHRLPGTLLEKLRAEFGGNAGLGEPDAGGRLHAMTYGALPRETTDILCCEFTPQWREENRHVEVFELISQHGIELDSWERLVLETALFFPSVRWSRAAGDGG